MGTEMSLVSAAVARMAEPTFHLAAFGGIIFPLALLIESPIIMMLAASTALSTDLDSFRRVRRYTTIAALILTGVHVLVAFTPLYDLFVVRLITPPAGAIEPGRLGLRLMVLWTWAIADRRFHQGALIRFGRSRAVGAGTLVRLAATGLILGGCVWHGGAPGVAVAGIGLTVGVTAEMLFIRWLTRDLVRGPLASASPPDQPLTLRAFLRFYLPLAFTPLIALLTQPIGAAAIARMSAPLANLAVWSPVNGLIFMTRSVGFAFNEVVVSLGASREDRRVLTRFAAILALIMCAILALVALTPLRILWFDQVTGLAPELVTLASSVLFMGLLLPVASVFQSLHTGLLVRAHRTRAIPQSMALMLLTSAVVLVGGVWMGSFQGIQVTLTAFTLGAVVQNLWLWLACRGLGRG